MQEHYSGQVSGPVSCSGEPLPGSFADPGAISPASVKRYAVAGMAGTLMTDLSLFQGQKEICL